jgi:hypothetical protein
MSARDAVTYFVATVMALALGAIAFRLIPC